MALVRRVWTSVAELHWQLMYYVTESRTERRRCLEEAQRATRQRINELVEEAESQKECITGLVRHHLGGLRT